MGAPRKYSLELQQRATGMALEVSQDPETARGAVNRIADQLGSHPEPLRSWLRQAQVDGGVRPGTTTDDARSLAELEREVRELRRANEILRTSAAFFRRVGAGPQDQVVRQVPVAVVVDYIDAHRGRVVEGKRLGVEPICEVLRGAGMQIAGEHLSRRPAAAAVGARYATPN